jgi:hypothetical protein
MDVQAKADTAQQGKTRFPDANTVVLAIAAVCLAGWLGWNALPAAVGSKTWLMDLTSSGDKLDNFYAAIGQEQAAASAAMASTGGPGDVQITKLEMPLRHAAGATVNAGNGQLRVELPGQSLFDSLGRRAVVLGSWPEDFFPASLRMYAMVPPDSAVGQMACVVAQLPAGGNARADFLSKARIRYFLVPNPLMGTRLESIAAPDGYISAQAFMIGASLKSVSIIGPDGVDRGAACPK